MTLTFNLKMKAATIALLLCIPFSSISAKTIKLGIDLWPGYYPAIIAAQKGFFAKHQLDVEVIIPENTDTMLSQFNNQKIDAVCVAAGDIILIASETRAAKIVMITDLSAGGDAIVSANNWNNKKHLTIGTNLGGFGEIFVRQFLKDYHIKTSSVNIIDIDASEAPELIRSQKLDLAHTWEPYVSQAKSLGGRIVYTSWQTPGLIPDVLAFHREFIEKHPDKVTAFINAWFAATNWWVNNLEEGNAIIQNYLNTTDEISLSGIKLMLRADNLNSFNDSKAPRNIVKVVQRYIDFYTEKGLLKHSISPKEILSSEFLNPPSSTK